MHLLVAQKGFAASNDPAVESDGAGDGAGLRPAPPLHFFCFRSKEVHKKTPPLPSFLAKSSIQSGNRGNSRVDQKSKNAIF